MVPVGILGGTILSLFITGSWYALTEGIVTSFGAGTFIYVATLDILVEGTPIRSLSLHTHTRPLAINCTPTQFDLMHACVCRVSHFQGQVQEVFVGDGGIPWDMRSNFCLSTRGGRLR